MKILRAFLFSIPVFLHVYYTCGVFLYGHTCRVAGLTYFSVHHQPTCNHHDYSCCAQESCCTTGIRHLQNSDSSFISKCCEDFTIYLKLFEHFNTFFHFLQLYLPVYVLNFSSIYPEQLSTQIQLKQSPAYLPRSDLWGKHLCTFLHCLKIPSRA